LYISTLYLTPALDVVAVELHELAALVQGMIDIKEKSSKYFCPYSLK
jgi:hypothetical protein